MNNPLLAVSLAIAMFSVVLCIFLLWGTIKNILSPPLVLALIVLVSWFQIALLWILFVYSKNWVLKLAGRVEFLVISILILASLWILAKKRGSFC